MAKTHDLSHRHSVAFSVKMNRLIDLIFVFGFCCVIGDVAVTNAENSQMKGTTTARPEVSTPTAVSDQTGSPVAMSTTSGSNAKTTDAPALFSNTSSTNENAPANSSGSSTVKPSSAADTSSNPTSNATDSGTTPRSTSVPSGSPAENSTVIPGLTSGNSSTPEGPISPMNNVSPSPMTDSAESLAGGASGTATTTDATIGQTGRSADETGTEGSGEKKSDGPLMFSNHHPAAGQPVGAEHAKKPTPPPVSSEDANFPLDPLDALIYNLTLTLQSYTALRNAYRRSSLAPRQFSSPHHSPKNTKIVIESVNPASFSHIFPKKAGEGGEGDGPLTYSNVPGQPAPLAHPMNEEKLLMQSVSASTYSNMHSDLPFTNTSSPLEYSNSPISSIMPELMKERLNNQGNQANQANQAGQPNQTGGGDNGNQVVMPGQSNTRLENHLMDPFAFSNLISDLVAERIRNLPTPSPPGVPFTPPNATNPGGDSAEAGAAAGAGAAAAAGAGAGAGAGAAAGAAAGAGAGAAAGAGAGAEASAAAQGAAAGGVEGAPAEGHDESGAVQAEADQAAQQAQVAPEAAQGGAASASEENSAPQADAPRQYTMYPPEDQNRLRPELAPRSDTANPMYYSWTQNGPAGSQVDASNRYVNNAGVPANSRGGGGGGVDPNLSVNNANRYGNNRFFTKSPAFFGQGGGPLMYSNEIPQPTKNSSEKTQVSSRALGAPIRTSDLCNPTTQAPTPAMYPTGGKGARPCESAQIPKSAGN